MNPGSKLRQVAILAQASCLAIMAFSQHTEAFGAWQPAKGRLMTKWARDVSPKNALPEYPRPILEREEWQSLNGLWDYSIAPKEATRPEQFAGQILVPYPIESALSGVMKEVGEANRLWYRRTFNVPNKWSGKRIMLHFGAVDWEATVFVNGKEMGIHRGGYDPFSFDITSALKEGAQQELVVAVWDPTDASTQPRGKQVRKPHAIWYTSVTGIWQTPWLEPVATTSIASTRAVPDIDAGVLDLSVQLRGHPENAIVEAVALDGRRQVAKASVKGGDKLKLSIPKAKLWSPDSPHLYNLKLTVRENGKVVDEVTSYFGMRKIALGKDDKGTLRLFLNNQPLFQFGPLDQGWWPDGLYTAPTDEALKYDIEMTKDLGFNMARKHVKVEPERWYYWCDKLGLLVWQDMPSGDKYINARDPDIKRSEASASQFQTELKAMIDGRFNHPCIVMWVPFNEGWGQFDTERVTKWVKNYDPSRLVNNASGWADRGVGDVNDIHVYPGPAAPKLEAGRAGVLGEYGGLGLPIRGHTWQDEKNWGYRSYTNSETLTAAYLALIKKLHPLAGAPGLAAAVYTQTTDVEIEVNGLLTYDRELIKMDKKAITAANRKLYQPPPPPPVIKTLSPTSEKEGVPWQYTTEKPEGKWMDVSFDDSSWKKGPGGFGEPSTPGSVVHTRWKTPDIWLRRSFEVPAGFKAQELQVLVHHDEDAEIYLNGTQIARFSGHIGRYEMLPVNPKAASLLKEGRNVLAVHCHQTTGGQYIDVGLMDVQQPETSTAIHRKKGKLRSELPGKHNISSAASARNIRQ